MKARIIVGAALLISLVSAPALAYILPSDAILSGVARRRAQLGFKSLILEGTLHRADASGPDEGVYEAIRPGLGHRIEHRGPDGSTISLTVGGRRWEWRSGERAPAPTKARPDLPSTFLVNLEEDPGGKRGSAFLASRGIDENVVSLSRLGRRVAYVIGAKPWETGKPQLWIDKVLRVPIRLIEIDPKSKSMIDTRLLDYGSGQTGEWYPRKVETWKDGVLVETTVYREARVNEAVDEALFKPPS